MGPVAQLVFKTSAVVQPTARSVRLRRRSVLGDGYALLVEPLSPELALVDPELAERARALLVEPPELPTARAARTKPVKAKRRSHGRTAAVVAAIAVAALLGGAGAIWARYDSNESSVRRSEPPPTTSTRRKTQAPPTPRRPLRPPGRPPAFHVPGAPKEPLDEMTLPARARRLEAWLTPSRSLTSATLHHWLYQHAWVVTGARFGWWHGAEAIRTLIRVDRRVEARWGVGYRSEAAARQALAEVEAKEGDS